jgi:hypothetical protein
MQFVCKGTDCVNGEQICCLSCNTIDCEFECANDSLHCEYKVLQI